MSSTGTLVDGGAGVRRLAHFIDGEWRDGGGAGMEVRDPSTGALLAQGAGATRADVEAAIEAAAAAWREYRHAPLRDRVALCHGIAGRLLARRDELARDISREQGKPLSEALGEVDVSAEMFAAAAEDARRLSGEVLPSMDPAKRIAVVREPLGVVGVVTPWNFPMSIPTEYLSAALATGNTVVWKPAGYTPVTALNVIDCAVEAGLPRGVVNLVIGPGAMVGAALTSHPAVRAIGATGSPATGEALAATAGMRRLLLELGGNGPAIVLDDADLERAIARIALGCFANAGQICDSTERILVHERLRDALVEGLAAEAARVVLGPSLEPGTTMGPLTSEENAGKVDAHLDDARRRGARIVAGGHRQEGFATRLYYQPTVIDGVTPDMLLSREETFGPVAPVVTFRDDEEALRLANDNEVGLVSGVFTRDLARAQWFAERLESGIVNVNEGPTYWQPHTPFGGYAGKRSGIGRLGGRYTLLELTQTKAIVTDVQRG
jgi:acyl-CoA reductase-like NAD-dependent aldehyde dehydrogenase